MAEPILVVDPGFHSTAAALVPGEAPATDPAVLIRDATGAVVWSGIRGVDVDPAGLAALLAAVRAEGGHVAGRGLDRLVLTVPTGWAPTDPRRELLIAAGEAAGFRDVELVGQVRAALIDARGHTTLVAAGALVLVCDLGETWSASLCHIGVDDVDVIARETSTAGRDLDAMLLDDLRTQLRDWVEPALAAPGEAGAQARHDAMEFLRRLKHGLGEEREVVDRLSPAMPPYRLSVEWLGRLAEPGLLWIAGSARSMVARASTTLGGAVPRGATLHDIATVVLVGGAARLPSAEVMLAAALDRPIMVPPEPDFAVLRGAARWAGAADARRIPADHPRWRVETLQWAVPTGQARLERWLRPPGETYPRGAALAQIRTADERVYDLTAAEEGALLERQVRVGELVGPALTLVARRPASCLTGDPPDRLGALTATGEWLLTPDRQLLVECGAGARHVKLWSIPDGRLVDEFQPRLDGDDRHQGRVFVSPQGRLCMVAWDPAGGFSVWDVRAGRRLISFHDPNPPREVLVNEPEWRLTAEGEDNTFAGRYRRPVATVWDLRTGARLERLTEDFERRLVGYRRRSAVDGFGERATSPDGRLRAVAVRTTGGSLALALHESTSDHEVFRTEHAPVDRVRAAFSSDGRFLLANWESEQDSQVEVWEL